jgi:NAD(P)H-hydrate epimerase
MSFKIRPEHPAFSKALTARQMRKADDRAIHEIGIPALCLMENAGRAVAQHVGDYLRRHNGRSVCCVCGTGNNGGDGCVAVRHLVNAGYRLTYMIVGDATKMTPEAAVNAQVLDKLSVRRIAIDKISPRSFQSCDALVDALFGTGLSREVVGLPRRVIEAMNASHVPVFSVDVPSGLDATTGDVWGVAVKAHCTVALAYPKRGFFRHDGPRFTGRMVVEDIGIPYGRIR